MWLGYFSWVFSVGEFKGLKKILYIIIFIFFKIILNGIFCYSGLWMEKKGYI